MFDKTLGYFRYRKIIKENKDILSKRYNFRYDWIYGRLYTVLNVTEDKQEVLKAYGYEFLDNEVKKFLSSIDNYLFSIGLVDYVSISKIDRIDTVNVLIVLRYKYKLHQTILYILMAIGLLTISVATITGFVKLMILLSNFIMAI